MKYWKINLYFITNSCACFDGKEADRHVWVILTKDEYFTFSFDVFVLEMLYYNIIFKIYVATYF